jgi:Na+-translocating ferredoxin:NAD+ oxidoreductase RNF subunit RnfB
MASTMNEGTEGFKYIQCPFSIITGCECMTVVNGYCTGGKYCIKDCAYAWSSMQDDA